MSPTDVYRGVGCAEAIFTTERVIENNGAKTRRESGGVPAEALRSADQFPFDTTVGSTYDGGEYEPAQDEALDTADYEALRERQERLREGGAISESASPPR